MAAEDGFFLAILAFMGIFIVFMFLFAIVMYFFMAFGLYRMAENQNIELSWLAFIPIAQYYLLGVLVQSRLTGGMREGIPWILASLLAANFFLGIIAGVMPLIGFLALPISLASVGFTIYASFHLYKKYSEQYVVLFVFTIVTLGMLAPIFVFFIRNNMPLEEEAAA
ncbi:hypothetical protein [Geomicrobium sp. JCM 19038]|uniref:hypothetical protein n=1 Tax=Geomicrobium sp. JCM 19038 TaxID=1460635 RepID=UPI00045F3D36|nr:hypothetical protein [Geomicrobium sp. JCM 19038]GAK07252.1 hypothetical protein JCM19038_974 [Geomicrobium sp. JCM 19038]